MTRDVLENMARTSLSSKSIGAKKELLSKISVDAVLSVHEKRATGSWLISRTSAS